MKNILLINMHCKEHGYLEQVMASHHTHPLPPWGLSPESSGFEIKSY
jgi:hypothetical protein